MLNRLQTMDQPPTNTWTSSTDWIPATDWPHTTDWTYIHVRSAYNDWTPATDWPNTTDWSNTSMKPHPLSPTLYPLLATSDTPTANHTKPVPSMAEVLRGMVPFRVALLLVTWLFPLVVGVGVLGNVVSLWVLLRRGMRRTSACRYLACLAVADIVVLLVSALKTWVRVVWDFELLHVSNVTCKLFIFLTHLSLMAAAWLIVAVTLKRFLVVWLPLRATQVYSVGRTRVVVVTMLVLLALINSHVFWTAELLPVSSGRSLSSSGVQCSSYAYKTLACKVFPWVHLVLYCFVPATLLLSLNSLILYKLFQHRQAIPATDIDSRSSRSSSNRTTIANNVQHQNLLPTKRSQLNLLLKAKWTAGPPPSSCSPHQFHRRLAPMLLGVSFCWLFLTTPQTLYTLAVPPPSSMQQASVQFLVKTVCFLLMYLNHAVHFFLYCMTGQRFRQELRRGLDCANNSHSAHRLKKGFRPKWPAHDPAPPSDPVECEAGEEGAAAALNQPYMLCANDMHGSGKEVSHDWLKLQSHDQINPDLHVHQQHQLLRLYTANGKCTESH